MKIVVFGLAISSSWGNGHATLWRGLVRALVNRGHDVVFYERDVPFYRRHRDLFTLERGRLILYETWEDIRRDVPPELKEADVAMITSYCPDALDAETLVHASGVFSVFYDLDSGVTLTRIQRGEPVEYIGARGLRDYDLVLSYTGGKALDALREVLHARCVAPLYGSVDPDAHFPAAPNPAYRCDLSYIATHSEDRYDQVIRLLVEPARREPQRRFLIAGPQYPLDFPWRENIHYIEHVAPEFHPVFYSSSRLTLSLTRAAMAAMGYCPSGRLFEAAAARVPMLTDGWDGLEHFFEPNRELLVVRDTADVMQALTLTNSELHRIADAARARTLSEHTSMHRALELERLLETTRASADSKLLEV